MTDDNPDLLKAESENRRWLKWKDFAEWVKKTSSICAFMAVVASAAFAPLPVSIPGIAAIALTILYALACVRLEKNKLRMVDSNLSEWASKAGDICVIVAVIASAVFAPLPVAIPAIAAIALTVLYSCARFMMNRQGD